MFGVVYDCVDYVGLVFDQCVEEIDLQVLWVDIEGCQQQVYQDIQEEKVQKVIWCEVE